MKLFISLLMTALLAISNTLVAQSDGELVLFIQDGRSISQDFKRNTLPKIRTIAKQNDLKVKIVDASKGAPPEVTYTPAIFYHKGDIKKIFNGRYTDVKNLSAFVKSKGQVQPVTLTKSDAEAMTWNIGRATLNATIHINPLNGTPPKSKSFDTQKFEKEARVALTKGMEYFRPGKLKPGEHAKSFHMEFYPEVNRKEGVLLIQMKLYSAYDPTTPVFKTEIPSGSQWNEWQVAFEKAGNRLEKALIAQISNWDNGDGFDTLKAPVESWGVFLRDQYMEDSTIHEKGLGRLSAKKGGSRKTD